MNFSFNRVSNEELEHTINTYSDMLFKLCFTILANTADTEDAISETFIRYSLKSPHFNSQEHQKAWLIRVATNIAKDIWRKNIKHTHLNLDEIAQISLPNTNQDILNDIINLPLKYKTVLHLYYIEGYNTNEIAKILLLTPPTIRKRLQYARNLLKLEYTKEN